MTCIREADKQCPLIIEIYVIIYDLSYLYYLNDIKIMYHFSLSSSIGAGSLDIINSTYICMIEFTLESNITAINNNNQANWKGCCFNQKAYSHRVNS